MFPRVSDRSRATFGLALAALATMLVGFALLRWQAPLIAIGAVGVALVFIGYVRQAGHDLPARQLIQTAALAAVLGVGWALATGSIVAESHDVALSGGELDREKLLTGIAIPVGGAIAMLIPAAVLRLRRGVTRLPFDGYAVGALSAVVFTSAATSTRLVPQFATGFRAEDLWVSALLVQAGIQGLTLPLTALTLGGLVGLALWAGRPRMIVASVIVTLVLYTIMGVTEYTPAPHIVHLIVHAAIAVVALAALRGGQRAAGPLPQEPNPEGEAGRARVLVTLGVGAAIAVTAGAVTAVLTTPDVPKIVCPPDCGRPPIGEPIESNPRFYAADGSFSVQYPGPGSAYEATLLPDGVELEFTGGDTGMLELFGLPAANRTAKQVAEDLIDEYYPDAATEYEIPNAMVGYEPGYGVVADDYPQDASGSFTRLRLIVMVAVKNDVALVASAIGPYREFTPDFGTGHPSGANLQLAIDMGKYVNSFRWTGVTD